MPDDERTRRRLGDATRNRIADLASGWSVGEDEPPELTPEPPPEPVRQRPKTQPPPPPGSAARKQLEEAIVEAVQTPVPGTLKADDAVKPPVRTPPSAPVPASRTSPPSAPLPRSNPPAAPRTKPPSVPPRTNPPAAPRTNPPTAPPPIPPAARKATNAPFGAKAGPTETGTVSLAGAIGTSSIHKSVVDPADTPAHLAALAAARAGHDDADDDDNDDDDKRPVPRGEFETGSGAGTEVEKAKLRIAYEQSTMKRDAASALLGIPELPMTVVKPQPVEVLLHETAEVLMRGDPTSIDSPATTKFERGDPTSSGGDPTLASTGVPDMSGGGTLRAQATLKRKRGLGGDVRYVWTVLFGVRKARQELSALEAQQVLRQQSRKRYLVTLGRAAATSDGFDHPALGPACETLVKVEDERAQHVAAVNAADGELARVRTGREAKAKEHAEEIKQLEAELIELGKKLEPLEKEVSAIGKRAADLKDSLRKLDQKIANTEMKAQNAGPNIAAIQAEIATLKADRIAVSRDEPKLAAELDALNPRIASLEARRAEAKRRRTEIEEAEREDQKRCDDLLAAIGAKRKVVDRAASDAETMRDKVLFELGERLYVDRPLDLGPQLAPIDAIDMELGTGDRRTMELKEILQSVDKAKLARGIGVLVLAVALVVFLVLLFTGAI